MWLTEFVGSFWAFVLFIMEMKLSMDRAGMLVSALFLENLAQLKPW